MQQDEVVPQHQARVVQAGVRPERQQAVRQQPVRVGVANRLRQQHRAALLEHGDRPGGRRDPLGIFVGDGMDQPDGRAGRIEFDLHALGHPGSRIAAPVQFHAVRDWGHLQPGIVREVGRFQGFRAGPQAVPAQEMEFTAGGVRGQVEHVREQVGRTVVREPEDARAAAGQVFQPEVFVFEDCSGEGMEISHGIILSSG